MMLHPYFIEPEGSINPKERQPASYIRGVLNVDGEITKAELTMTACGVYQCYINGDAVTNQVFMPGFTYYTRRLQYQTYDVTHLLTRGTNVVGVVLGDGWFRGKIGAFSRRNYYGEKTKLSAVINVTLSDGSVVEFTTGPHWEATQDGPVRRSDWKDGEVYDARRELGDWLEPDSGAGEWHAVIPSAYEGELVAEEGEPILEHEEFGPKVLTTPDGSTVLDFGQNLFGYVEFSVQGPAGHTVRLTHGEVLDEHGNFTLKNVSTSGLLQNRLELRQEVTYTLRDGPQRYKPHFTAHGFRYVLVSNWPEEVKPENFTAIAIYSDMAQSGDFSCSNPLLNKVLENTRWSQKGNFLDIPTDCPTRERAGWTGDIAVFSETGGYLMDINRFLAKWLKDLALQQDHDGRVGSIVPAVGMFKYMDGSAGWADAAVIVPYTLYRLYGNTNVLRAQYESMKKWLTFVQNRAQKTRLLSPYRRSDYREFIVDTGYHWGEWLEPGHDMGKDVIRNTFSPDSEVATAYFAYSAALVSEIAEILGKTQDASTYAELARTVKSAYRDAFTNDGLIDSNRQCRYVRPVALDLLPEEDKARNVACLNELVISNDYRIGTGFLTTPFILPVLTDYGFADTAYRVALNRKRPGWLYEVDSGATTIWENWHGIDDGNVPRDSFNHYSFGTITGWLFSRVAGIMPMEPGFKRVLIRPTPGGDLGWVKCSYDSAAGLISSSWRVDGSDFLIEIQVPTEALVELPDGRSKTLPPGVHNLSCTLPG